MLLFKNIIFSEGIEKMPLKEFKQVFEVHLKGLSEQEVKEAYKVATNGKVSEATKKSTRANPTKGK